MMRRGFLSLVTLLFVPLIISSPIKAQEQQASCLALIKDNMLIKQSIKEGTFRDEIAPKQAANFSYDSQLSFQSYLDYAAKHIEQQNPHASRKCPIKSTTYSKLVAQGDRPEAAKVQHLLAPFELRQPSNEKGILLIHGLTDSPFHFYDLANYFHEQGFNVRTLLLPGHGTAPSALRNIDVRDWRNATTYAIERMLQDYQEVYLGGFSTGGGLIFDYLMQRETISENIKGMVMWSPASRANTDSAWMAQYVDYVPFVNWLDKDADVDFAKYESFPFNAAAQVHDLMSDINEEKGRKKRHFHQLPLLVIASEADSTIDTNETLAMLKAWHMNKPVNHGEKEITADTLIYYGDRSKAVAALPSMVKVITPECKTGGVCEKVNAVAHTGTLNAPANTYYGEAGAYRSCGHYLDSMTDYFTCKNHEAPALGEITEQNKNAHPVLQRLTFNPYYPQMLTSISQFFADIEQAQQVALTHDN